MSSEQHRAKWIEAPKPKINQEKAIFMDMHFSRAFESVFFYWEHSISCVCVNGRVDGWCVSRHIYERTYLHTSYNGEFDAFQAIFRINNVKLDT